MKLTRERKLTVNMGNYESLVIGASVEVEVNNPDDSVEYLAACARADDLLDLAIAKDLAQAQKLTYTKDSFVLSLGEEGSNA